jgi:hypothetical protein
MRHRLLVVGAGLLIFLSLAWADAGQSPSVDRRIEQLITQLGSDSYADREYARKELEAIGTPALTALRRVTNRGDLETTRRAADLVRIIEERALTAELLTPKKVHLALKDVPVLQAVDKLAKLSGYTLRVDGDRTGLGDRSVTIDTGEVAFWEAVDRLGVTAGLIEKLTIASLPGDSNAMNIGGRVWQEAFRPGIGKGGPRRVAPPPLRVVRLPKISPAAGQPKADAEEARDPVPAKKADPGPPPVTTEETVANANQTPQVLSGRVILTPAAGVQQHASYAGAARVLLKPTKAPPVSRPRPSAGNYYDVILEASAEPRLLGFAVVGVPTVVRAIDEHDQALSFVIDPVPAAPRNPGLPVELIEALAEWEGMVVPIQPVPRSMTVRLQQGARPAKRLKELSGSLTAQVLMPNTTLAVVDDIRNAKGKMFDIKGGGRLHIQSIEKTQEIGPHGYRLVYQLENLSGTGGPNLLVVRGGRAIYANSGPLSGDGVPSLLDTNGRPLMVIQGPNYTPESTPEGHVLRTTGTMLFRGDVSEPARFVLSGTHMPTIVVPFRFTNVPLP